MDQKHNMLYPPIAPGVVHVTQDQRMLASAAIGLPAEAPPSYDMAMCAPSAQNSQQMDLQLQSTASGVDVISYEPPQNILPNIETISTDITPNTNTATILHLGPQSCSVTCPICQSRQKTKVTYSSTLQTHLCSIVLCLVGFCCCACFLPYCLTSCRTGNHYCKKCGTYLGAYKQTWK